MKDKTTSLTCKYAQYTFENTGNRFTKKERKKIAVVFGSYTCRKLQIRSVFFNTLTAQVCVF